MFDAAKSGNDMVLESIFRFNPTLFTKVDSDGRSLLHIAILYRQVSVFRLIMSKGAYKNTMVQVVDNDGNNVLHLAAKLVAEERFPSMVFLMCSEERWFTGVEEIVPPAFKRLKNRDGNTPEELFYKDHKELSKNAIGILNQGANTFLVVGTLIVTLGITAALTIRTNTIQGRLPMFDEKTWYIIFLLSVTVGVISTVISMLQNVSIMLLRSRKQTLDYVNSLEQRLTIGNLFLLAALGILCTFAVMSGVILIFAFFPKWTFCIIAAFILFPILWVRTIFRVGPIRHVLSKTAVF
ncbi:hypothetical protein PIB30_014323 [Stylosanthes scabra]|uniref:PGG domain-containing protein n=1 Tax=Stylosanthes scabra TaxID=79078 RepID=A0ABU6Q7G2_9FABA|nr:hypothetical protein [Stylosanthes scabra]